MKTCSLSLTVSSCCLILTASTALPTRWFSGALVTHLLFVSVVLPHL